MKNGFYLFVTVLLSVALFIVLALKGGEDRLPVDAFAGAGGFTEQSVFAARPVRG